MILRLVCDNGPLPLPHDAVSEGVPHPDDALLRRELDALAALVVQVDCAPWGLVDAKYLQVSCTIVIRSQALVCCT